MVRKERESVHIPGFLWFLSVPRQAASRDPDHLRASTTIGGYFSWGPPRDAASVGSLLCSSARCCAGLVLDVLYALMVDKTKALRLPQKCFLRCPDHLQIGGAHRTQERGGECLSALPLDLRGLEAGYRYPTLLNTLPSSSEINGD